MLQFLWQPLFAPKAAHCSLSFSAMMKLKSSKIVLCCAAAAAISTSTATAASSSSTKQQSPQDAAAAIGDSNSSLPNILPSIPSRQKPIHLKGVPNKLSERMESFAVGELDSDFLERLRSEEQALLETSNSTRQKQTPRSAKQVIFWGITGGMLLLVATTSFGSSSVMSFFTWEQVVSTSMSLYWLAWIKPGMSLGELLTPLTSIVLDGNARVYVMDTVLPHCYKMVKRIVVAELWNAYFRTMWKELEAFFSSTGREETTAARTSIAVDKGSSSNSRWWLYDQHKIVVDVLERGTKKVIQSSLQKQMQACFRSMSSTMMDLLKQVSLRGMSGLLVQQGDCLSVV
ncbi:hypothetical protein MPSEU_000691700 [Mayamaea pseudoterrestris]|nr:hypothetical protein MPSEU_000691700 [Mayamaea pseudoterrestris]